MAIRVTDSDLYPYRDTDKTCLCGGMHCSSASTLKKFLSLFFSEYPVQLNKLLGKVNYVHIIVSYDARFGTTLVRCAGRQRHAIGQVQSRDAKMNSSSAEEVELSQRHSGTSFQSPAGDASKPPPIAAKPRVKSTAGQYWKTAGNTVDISYYVTVTHGCS